MAGRVGGPSALKSCNTGNWPQTSTHGILPAPHIALWRGKHGKAEEAESRPHPRVGADRAPVRLARAEGVREGQAASPLRRAGPGAGAADRDLRAHPLPQGRRLPRRRHGKLLRIAEGQAAGAAAPPPPEDRWPQRRAPPPGPGGDRDPLLIPPPPAEL